MRKLNFLLIIAALASACTTANADPRLTTPPGFAVQTLPFSVPNARQMALTKNGNLIIGTRKAGKVYAVLAPFTENARVITLLRGLNMPSGIAVLGNDLYVAAVSTVYKVADIDQQITTNPRKTIVTSGLPKERHHGWKYLKAGPDEQLYLPVGAPCNICLSDDPRFATMLRLEPNSGELPS